MSGESAGETNPTTHPDFDFSDSDVTCCSSDNILFNLHRVRLGTAAGVFPGAEFDANGEVVQLQEPGEVLEVLFQFVYAEKIGNIEDLEFDLLMQVAEAAEKYQMYAGKAMCDLRFLMLIPRQDCTIPILVHAMKHDVTKLIDASARQACLWPVMKLLAGGYPIHSIYQWAFYLQKCHRLLFADAQTYLDMQIHRDSRGENRLDLERRCCSMAVSHWMNTTMEGLRSLSDFPKFIEDSFRRHQAAMPLCREGLNEWELPCCNILDSVVDLINSGIQDVDTVSFSSILSGKIR
ncbi:hypothetical protein JR316_0008350 [Psilocybe cubensis]|uniref:Uncharacterized protein n=2 Tax=Psilocybe cubensis TaxID=181762 RepID=A0ACB8GVJ6_PSICU|nr:hypothetical protein JR316_0008350 [Psilocybe cubensis]KAH9479755.1 hypothetical protein JR316_0008350 [Psilocybe cubensis]